ncbi:deaminase reductase [Longispora fulva]|uniref:Dihydrofolate reductase n=1 Tax=Longispora fulva TaxID=619741 RepID=A0A8J7GPM6_9ACTN|nr:dihydrofolate reductase family protein [Longispora fulva]MBG6136649.1 dihydrofolate reductase [Longispora fulva]GIG59818.1 deaminase reductase [Longispora fulva]
MKLTVTTFVSLDGVLQGPGGPEEDRTDDFDLGGWLIPYADAGFGGIVVDWISDADAFLLGRRSYQLLSSHWPNVTDPNDPIAAKLNTLPKYVPSSTLTTLDWANSHLLTGDLVEEVTKLKAQPGQTLQVHGSGQLIQTLLAAGLVDELRLLTFPVVLGKGQRLFEAGATPAAWRLTGVKSTDAGIIAHTYTYAGTPALGNIVITDGQEELVSTQDA